MIEKCPSCNKDISNLPSSAENCPHCGAKLEVDLWDELFDEEKERKTLAKMREQKELHARRLRRNASVVGLNVIVSFTVLLIYSVSLHHWLGVALSIGLVAITLLFDSFTVYSLISERKLG